jgi:hypothetical protein
VRLGSSRKGRSFHAYERLVGVNSHIDLLETFVNQGTNLGREWVGETMLEGSTQHVPPRRLQRM